MGATMFAFASRASPVRIWATAAAVAASAASTADFASSRFWGVMRPYCLSWTARSYSRRARVSDTRAWASTALSAAMPASVSVVSSRASGAPFAHRHPLGHVDRPDDAGDLGLHVGRELRVERADDSTLSSKTAVAAGATETATGGRPASWAAFGSAGDVEPEQAAAASAAAARERTARTRIEVS